MKPDAYGGADPMRVLADLRRDVDRLMALVGQVQGVPVTQASAPFFIPSASAPAAPGSGAYLYVSGGEVRVRATSIDYSTRTVVPVAGSVTPADNITSGNAPASYSQSWAQQIYDGLVSSKNTVNAIRSALVNAGLMAS